MGHLVIPFNGVVPSLVAQKVDAAPPRAKQPAWLRRKIPSPPAFRETNQLVVHMHASDAAEPA
eukprot:1588345-Rhodomonas_salina.1